MALIVTNLHEFGPQTGTCAESLLDEDTEDILLDESGNAICIETNGELGYDILFAATTDFFDFNGHLGGHSPAWGSSGWTIENIISEETDEGHPGKYTIRQNNARNDATGMLGQHGLEQTPRSSQNRLEAQRRTVAGGVNGPNSINDRWSGDRDYSLIIWVDLYSIGAEDSIWYVGTEGSFIGTFLDKNTSDKIVFSIGNGTAFETVESTNAVGIGEIMIGLVHNANTQEMKVYVDGALEGTTALATTPSSLTNEPPQWGAAPGMNGAWDMFQCFGGKVLSDAEMLAFYNGGVPFHAEEQKAAAAGSKIYPGGVYNPAPLIWLDASKRNSLMNTGSFSDARYIISDGETPTVWHSAHGGFPFPTNQTTFTWNQTGQNGIGTLSFAGVGTFRASNMNESLRNSTEIEDFTAFWAVKSGDAATKYLMNTIFNLSGSRLNFTISSSVFRYSDGTNTVSSTTAPGTAWNTFAVRKSGTSVEVWANGSLEATGTGTATINMDRWNMFDSAFGTSNGFIGETAIVVLWEDVLTDLQMADVFADISAKWGI